MHGFSTCAAQLPDLALPKGATLRRLRHAELGQGMISPPCWHPAVAGRSLLECEGHLIFARGDYLAAVAGRLREGRCGLRRGRSLCDAVHGNRDFVCSSTVRSGHADA